MKFITVSEFGAYCKRIYMNTVAFFTLQISIEVHPRIGSNLKMIVTIMLEIVFIIRGILNLWARPSTKTTKIGSPRIKSILQYATYHFGVAADCYWLNIIPTYNRKIFGELWEYACFGTFWSLLFNFCLYYMFGWGSLARVQCPKCACRPCR